MKRSTHIVMAALVAGVIALLSFSAPQTAPAQSVSYLGINDGKKTPSESIRELMTYTDEHPSELGSAEMRRDLTSPETMTPAQDPLIKDAPFTRPIRLGVQSSLLKSSQRDLIMKTRDHLVRLYGLGKINVFYLDDQSLTTAIRAGQVDFFISDVNYFTIEEGFAFVEALASLWPSDSETPQNATASVIVARKNGEREAPDLHDLATRPIVAIAPESLSGWLAAAVELKKHHVFMGDDLLAHTTFANGDVSAVFTKMNMDPKVVGVLPACELEYMAEKGDIKLRDYWVVNQQMSDGLRCLHSSALYPSWVFAATSEVKPAVRKAITTALFTMDGKKMSAEWSMPVSNRPIYDLFYTLKIGPYQDLAQWSLRRFVESNAQVLAFISLLLFMILTYAGTLSVLVRRRTKLLRQALAERDQADQEMQVSRQHIENLERTGLVGQMSTVIAHELKQPLGAVSNYANSLLRRLKRGDINEERFEMALTEIVEQTARASEIVERVRSYAKHDYPPRKVDDISAIIDSAIQTFRRSRNTKAAVVVRMRPKSLAEVDAWEIELAILNLLKNAADALVSVNNPRIDVRLEQADENDWRLTVGDNGPYLTDEELARFFKPLQTSKGEAGMGLGLPIVANIAERHAGNITVSRNGERGVKFTILFPRYNDPNLKDQVPWPKGDEEVIVYQAGGNGPVYRKTLNIRSMREARRLSLESIDLAFDEGEVPRTVHSSVLTDVARVMEMGKPISAAQSDVTHESNRDKERKWIDKEVDRFVKDALDIDESDVPRNA